MVRATTAIGAAILSVIPLSSGFNGSATIEAQTSIPIQAPGKKPSFDLTKLPSILFFWEGDEKTTVLTTLAAYSNTRFEKALKRQGIVNPNEIKEAIKYVNDEAEKFNKLIAGKKVNVIEFDKDKRINEPVLKPSVSPYEAIRKYPLARAAYPIILESKAPKQIDMKSLTIRKYVDPSDGKTKDGIYFKYIPQNKNDKIEELLVPDYANLAIFDGKQVTLTAHLVPVFGPDDFDK